MPSKELLNEYRKERKRVRDLIRRMKKRGFIDLDDVLPPIPKKITAGSVRRLKELTPRKLQEKARYVKPGGEIVSGRAGRLYEIKQASKKAAATQKKKRQTEKAKEAPAPEQPKSKEEKTAAPPPGPSGPSEKDIIIQRIRDYIAQNEEENPSGKEYVLDEFNRIVSEQEAKDGCETFIKELKSREEDITVEIDSTLHYNPDIIWQRPEFFSHFAEFKKILNECAKASGSSSDILDDSGVDLPFN